MIISINNYKGGSGKTSTAVNLAHVLSNDKKVLLIDLDPQGDASIKFCKNFREINGICEVFTNTIDINNAITNVSENLDILTAKNELNSIADEMKNRAKVFTLKNVINKIKKHYDYIIIDNNPKLDIMLNNCIYCADYMIVPVNIDNNAIKGADSIIKTIMDVIDEAPIDVNIDVRILMTIVTMLKNKPTNYAEEVIQTMRQKHGDKVFKTYIRMQPKLAQKTSFISSYFATDEDNKLSEDYINLSKELLNL